jgi:hypothetical protein
MLFFIIAIAAIIGVAVYVTNKTKSSPIAQTPVVVEETPFDVTPMVESTPPVTPTENVIPTTPPSIPTMTAKPKKKSSAPKAKDTKKPTKKKPNA